MKLFFKKKIKNGTFYFIYSNMKKLKNIKIDEILHTELKTYTKENSLKLNDWVEKMIKKEFEKIKIQNDDK